MSCLPESAGGRRSTGGAELATRRESEDQGKKCEPIMAVKRSLDSLAFATFPSRERRIYATNPDPLPPVLSNFKPLATDTYRKKITDVTSTDGSPVISALVTTFRLCL